MSLYKLNISSKVQKVYFSNVSYENKKWVHKGRGIIFDLEDSRAEYYFCLIAEHVHVYRNDKEEIVKPNANHMYDNNCSVYLYGNQCLSLNYYNESFLAPLEETI
jgi:hypothetical protein